MKFSGSGFRVGYIHFCGEIFVQILGLGHLSYVYRCALTGSRSLTLDNDSIYAFGGRVEERVHFVFEVGRM